MSQREWLDQDFYKELGVTSTASTDEIKKAYRKLARQLHPDKNPGNKEAEARFKRVSEAHSVLADPEKRKEYDEVRALGADGFAAAGRGNFGANGASGGYNSEYVNDAFSFGDFFSSRSSNTGTNIGDMFGGFFNSTNRPSTKRPPNRKRGVDLETDYALAFREAILGTTATLTVTAQSTCLDCAGSGSADKKPPTSCPQCHGSGYVDIQQGSFAFTEPCTRCDGMGNVVTKPCPACGAKGVTNRSRSVTVRIPPGTDNGARLRVPGQGQAGIRGNTPGDLYVNIMVKPDPIFKRTGNNIELTVPVSFGELALGATLSVPTIQSRVSVRIPPGTSDGQTLRVKGKGVPNKNGTSGDLMVHVKIAVPKNLSDAAKQALVAYNEAEKSSGFNPRTGWAGV